MNKKELIVVSDIETLSLRTDALVVSIAATAFFKHELKNESGRALNYRDFLNRGIEVFFDMHQQTDIGRNMQHSTLKFWEDLRKEQSKACWCLDNPVRDPVQVGVQKLTAHFQGMCNGDTPETTWYFRGSHFDAAIMDSLCDDFQIKRIWQYNKVRDLRTYFEAVNFDTANFYPPKEHVPHDALCDASWDAWLLQYAMRNGGN
jgi:hypothetical protein